MTELYCDTERKQQVVLYTIPEEERTNLRIHMNNIRQRNESRPQELWDYLSATFTSLYNSFHSYRDPYVIYSHKSYVDGIIPAILSTICPAHQTLEEFKTAYENQPITPNQPTHAPRTHSTSALGRSYIEYHYYTLDPECVGTTSSRPFCVNQMEQGVHHPDQYRLRCCECHPYERAYTLIYCIERSETIKGGHLVFYPHYVEERADYVTSCVTPQKELDIPLNTGSAVLLSGDTYYTIQPLTGPGKCLLMMVDLYLKE
jgi:hypothetical protein